MNGSVPERNRLAMGMTEQFRIERGSKLSIVSFAAGDVVRETGSISTHCWCSSDYFIWDRSFHSLAIDRA